MSAQQCGINAPNLSKRNCTTKAGQVVGFWLDKNNTGVSFANALLEATWEAKVNAIQDTRMLVLNPDFPDEATRNKAEWVIKEGNTGKRNKVRNGKLDYLFRYDDPSDCLVSYLKSFDSFKGYAYAITANEMIRASDNGTNLIPFEVSIFVDEISTPEGQDDTDYILVGIYIVPTKNYFTKTIAPYNQETNPWRPTQLNGIVDVSLSVVSSSEASSKVVVDATDVCSGAEITDFVTAGDFVIEDVLTGATQDATVLAAIGNRYTLTANITAATDYYIYRKTADLATDKGYETRNSAGSIVKTEFTAGA
jgi:hypothetical protein